MDEHARTRSDQATADGPAPAVPPRCSQLPEHHQAGRPGSWARPAAPADSLAWVSQRPRPELLVSCLPGDHFAELGGCPVVFFKGRQHLLGSVEGTGQGDTGLEALMVVPRLKTRSRTRAGTASRTSETGSAVVAHKRQEERAVVPVGDLPGQQLGPARRARVEGFVATACRTKSCSELANTRSSSGLALFCR